MNQSLQKSVEHKKTLPRIVFKSFVLLNTQSRHLFQNFLGTKVLKTVNLEIRNPNLFHHMNVLGHFLRDALTVSQIMEGKYIMDTVQLLGSIVYRAGRPIIR